MKHTRLPHSDNRLQPWLALLPVMLMAAFLLHVGLTQLPMHNNGDYYRVVGSMIATPLGALETTCHPILSMRSTPLSTMGAIFYLSTTIQTWLGADCISERSTFALLALSYLAGLHAYVRSSDSKLIVTATCALPVLVFYPFLQSYFEEAALFALMPWLCLGIRQLTQESRFGVFSVSAALFVFAKVQMIVFVPLLLLLLVDRQRRIGGRLRATLVAAAIISLAALAAHLGKHETHKPNAYNRYFNGIGWSLQGVSDWPASEFTTRHAYWYANRDQLNDTSTDYEPLQSRELMGSSYWPTGVELLKLHAPDKQLKADLLDRITLKNYLGLLSSSGELAWSVAREVYLVFAQSDYSIRYLREPDAGHLARLTHFAASHFGWIYLVLALPLLWLPGFWLRLLLGGLYLALPAVVAFGDGFYEYEKHMVPYFASAPLFFVLLHTPRLGSPVQQPGNTIKAAR